MELIRFHRSQGFTLIELLAAVGVVLTLAALVFGAMPGIRQRANETKCVGNLHALSGAFGAYIADYNAWPSFNREDPNNPGEYNSHPWYFSLLKQNYIPVKNEQREGYPCLVSDVLICPANKENPGSRYQWTPAPYPWRPNYTSNSYWGDNNGQPFVVTPTNDKVRPSSVNNPKAIVLIDSVGTSQVGYPNLAADWKKANCYIARSHKGGANALLANGSVVRITPESHPDIAERKYWDPRFVTP